ncbi:uncharacterized protein LOC107720344 [Sinocyclocheilus rhinocerous]|uniref:uncharacterized protein LOC107720344 n=1 Tax=Sinocyclocheilus rhinocerous TaxID=307959 RepID=UPI0007BA1452|nr:PREDICTED: uncharacterized protein LOC107720344 [Sinocyclocheilus rhinocerous]
MYFKCGNDTKIIQHLICLLAWCQAVETLTELTNLGQNVSINCDLEEKEIYWMLLKLPNRPVMILRLFSTSPTPFYYDASFRPKYSVHPKHHLFIKNVTLDELGVYYCMTTEAPPKFSNGTRLHIIEPTKLPECQNHAVVEYIEQNHTVVNFTDQIQRAWMIIVILSGLMHGVLVFVVIGVCCYSGEKIKRQEEDLEGTQFMPLELLQEPNAMVILQHCLEIVLGFLMPYGLIISSYMCILRRIRKTRFRRHIRSEKLILVIVITFGLTWLPFHIMNMVEQIRKKSSGPVLGHTAEKGPSSMQHNLAPRSRTGEPACLAGLRSPSLPEIVPQQELDTITEAQTPSTSCCFLCVFAVVINNVSLQVIVEGFIGGSVVLPCSSTQHDLELQDINVHWRHNGSKYVYDITKCKDSLEQQDPRYKNRAQTFPEEYERRNFSIKLINLTRADAGEFSCFITHSSYSKQETVRLFINETTGKQSTEEENQVPETQTDWWKILLICFCILLSVIIFLSIGYFMIRWRKRTQAPLEGQVSNCLFLLYSRMRS